MYILQKLSWPLGRNLPNSWFSSFLTPPPSSRWVEMHLAMKQNQPSGNHQNVKTCQSSRLLETGKPKFEEKKTSSLPCPDVWAMLRLPVVSHSLSWLEERSDCISNHFNLYQQKRNCVNEKVPKHPPPPSGTKAKPQKKQHREKPPAQSPQIELIRAGLDDPTSIQKSWQLETNQKQPPCPSVPNVFQKKPRLLDNQCSNKKSSTHSPATMKFRPCLHMHCEQIFTPACVSKEGNEKWKYKKMSKNVNQNGLIYGMLFLRCCHVSTKFAQTYSKQQTSIILPGKGWGIVPNTPSKLTQFHPPCAWRS